jgi:DNA mismatch endonuclease (patch repair protein)
MAQIRGRNTRPELTIFAALEESGIPFERHLADLPGRPDVAFPKARLVVFIDGDFWHGWRFPLWQHKLSEKWQDKIAATRQRDQRNFRRLRQLGWKVVRLWEHQIETSPAKCLNRILVALTATHSIRFERSKLL